MLDLGCGNGALTAKIHQAGKDVTGVDFTPSGIERARQSNPGVDFVIHDLNGAMDMLPLPPARR